MIAEGFEIPKYVKIENGATDTYARFSVEPFERGYGTTIGNSLRRVLLASLSGAAVTAVRLEDIQHEFSAIPGVKEDMAADLTLIVASRSIGADGVIADTSLPEQRIAIRVSANLSRGFKRSIGWISVAVLGGVLAKLGEGFWEQLWTLARAALSI